MLKERDIEITMKHAYHHKSGFSDNVGLFSRFVALSEFDEVRNTQRFYFSHDSNIRDCSVLWHMYMQAYLKGSFWYDWWQIRFECSIGFESTDVYVFLQQKLCYKLQQLLNRL